MLKQVVRTVATVLYRVTFRQSPKQTSCRQHRTMYAVISRSVPPHLYARPRRGSQRPLSGNLPSPVDGGLPSPMFLHFSLQTEYGEGFSDSSLPNPVKNVLSPKPLVLSPFSPVSTVASALLLWPYHHKDHHLMSVNIYSEDFFLRARSHVEESATPLVKSGGPIRFMLRRQDSSLYKTAGTQHVVRSHI